MPGRVEHRRPTDEAVERMRELLATDLSAGFAQLVRSYAPLIHSLHLRLTGSRADAEDLGQETFLRAYKALVGFPPERCRLLKPAPCLVTIATNVWRNRLRERACRPATVNGDDWEGWDGADTAPGPEQVVDADDGAARLARHLTVLPVRHREAVVMRHVIGLSYTEMAQVLACPPGTAKARTSRGLAAVRAMLERDAVAASPSTSV